MIVRYVVAGTLRLWPMQAASPQPRAAMASS